MNILFRPPRIRRPKNRDDLLLLRHIASKNRRIESFPYRITMVKHQPDNSRDVWVYELRVTCPGEKIIVLEIDRGEETVLYQGQSFVDAGKTLEDTVWKMHKRGWQSKKAWEENWEGVDLARDLRNHFKQISRY